MYTMLTDMSLTFSKDYRLYCGPISLWFEIQIVERSLRYLTLGQNRQREKSL